MSKSLFRHNRDRKVNSRSRVERSLRIENLENRAMLSGMTPLFASERLVEAKWEQVTVENPAVAPVTALAAGVGELVEPTAASSIPLIPGEVATGRIGQPGQQDFYTFQTTRNNQVIEITSIATSGTLHPRVTVFDADGGQIREWNGKDNVRFTTLPAGKYTIQVRDYYNSRIGNYMLGLERINPPSPNASSLSEGQVTLDSIDGLLQKNQYTFQTTTNNEVVEITSIAVSGNVHPRVIVFDAAGGQIRTWNGKDNHQIRLSQPGQYLIQVQDYYLVETGSYKIGFERISPPSANARSLSEGQVTLDSIDGPLQKNQYTFQTTRNNEIVEITSIPVSGNVHPRVIIFDAHGEQIRAWNGKDNHQIPLSQPGQYLIQVQDYYLERTGSYKIGFERISPSSRNARWLVGSGVTAGQIQDLLQKDQYIFRTTVDGEIVEFTSSHTSGTLTLRVTVFDAHGGQVRTWNGNTTAQVTFPKAGLQLVQVQDYSLVKLGGYRLGFKRINSPIPNSISLVGLTGDGAWWLAESSGNQFHNAPWGRWSAAAGWNHVVSGDFTGNGFDDVVGMASTGDWWIARSDGNGFVNQRWGRWSPTANWTDVLVGDFNGDGLADLAGRTAGGDWWIARSTGSSFVNEYWGRWSPSANWTDVVVGNFTGDRLSDIAGRASNGDWWIARSTGSGFVNERWGRWSATAGWTDVQVGDFNGDGLTDIAGRTVGGDWWIARSTGSHFVNQRWGRWSTTAGWTDVRVGDFTGNGLMDIAGRAANGDWWVARSTGTGFINERWGRWSLAAGWTDVHVADVNGDGQQDLVGRTDNGDWWIARSSGSEFVNERWGRWSTNIRWDHVLVGRFASVAATM
jgi:hypothetical protein